MSAIDELRRLLDERGVEWKAWDGTHPITVWHDETYLYEFVEYRLVNGAKQLSDCPSDNDGHCELTIKVYNCTPEQAIAVTLGPCSDSCNCTNGERTGERMYIDPATLDVTGATEVRQEDAGTCHIMTIGEFNGEGTEYYAFCSNCGYEFFDDDPLNYCPNCGRRIEVDDG